MMLLTSTSIFIFFAGDAGAVACCAIPIIVIVVVIVLIVSQANKAAKIEQERRLKQQQELQKAKENYYQSLRVLKSNPTNADLKQKTLRLGRRYSELTRQFHSGDKSITIYDEMALMNDINAACAAAGAVSFMAHQPVKTQTVEGRLKQLADLKERGLMSEDEYQKKRQKIIDDI